jgi:hypothetical protein
VQLGFGGLGMAAAAAVRGRVRIPLLRGRWQELASARGCTVRGAPGGSRTHTGRVLSPLPLPVGLRGRIVGGITVRGGWTCSRLRSWAAIVAGWGVAGRREVAGDSAS